MQGLKTLVFLAVVVMALVGLASSAPAENELSGMEQVPAMMVRAGSEQVSGPEACACTNAACVSRCRALGWRTGYCLNANWCLCHN